MKKRTIGVYFRMVFLLTFLLAFLNSGGSSQAAGEKDVTFLYTGNFLGQLVPQKG